MVFVAAKESAVANTVHISAHLRYESSGIYDGFLRILYDRSRGVFRIAYYDLVLRFHSGGGEDGQQRQEKRADNELHFALWCSAFRPRMFW